MRFDPSTFLAWQAAEQLAREAEIRLFYKASWGLGGELPDPTEAARARELRVEAGLRLRRALEEIRLTAESLKPGMRKETPWRSTGERSRLP